MVKRFSGNLGIVPALDIDQLDRIDEVVKATTGVEGVAGYKVGLSSVLRLGLAESIRRLRDITDLPLLYDHQKAGPDMPDMAAKFSQMSKDAGVDGLILFPVAGPTAVRGFVGEAINNGLIPVVGGEIPTPDYCAAGGGYLVDNALDMIIEHSVDVGADHFVLPARSPERVARWANWIGANVPDPVLFLTGFGPLGGSIADAYAAAAACQRKFAIVGRLITAAEAPGEAARRMYEEMQKAVG